MSTVKIVKWSFYVTGLCIGLILNFYQTAYEAYMRLSLLNERIIVTFSTTPHRIDNIQPTVETILKQNIRISKIYLAIPYVFKRDQTEYHIPEWLKNHRKIEIVRCEDYGPATKILGVIKNIQLDPKTIIITVDDDIKYPRNLVLQLAYQAKQDPNTAVGLAGVYPDFDEHGKLIPNQIGGFNRCDVDDHKVSILQGFAGIAYRRSFFADDIYEISNSPRECINSDDVYLSYYLAQRNVERVLLKSKFLNINQINYDNPVGLGADALHKLVPTPSEKHSVCITYLQEKFPNVEF